MTVSCPDRRVRWSHLPLGMVPLCPETSQCDERTSEGSECDERTSLDSPPARLDRSLVNWSGTCCRLKPSGPRGERLSPAHPALCGQRLQLGAPRQVVVALQECRDPQPAVSARPAAEDDAADFLRQVACVVGRHGQAPLGHLSGDEGLARPGQHEVFAEAGLAGVAAPDDRSYSRTDGQAVGRVLVAGSQGLVVAARCELRLTQPGPDVIVEAVARRARPASQRLCGASQENYRLLLPDYRLDCYPHACCTVFLAGVGVAGPQRSHTSAEGRCTKSGRVTPGAACSQFLVGYREDLLLPVGAVALHITPRELEQPPRPCDTPALADITKGDPGGKGHAEALDRRLAWIICCHITDLSGSACVVTSGCASVVT